MKRPPSSSRSKRATAAVHPGVEASPVVYLGPDALEALEKGRGVLLGAQRPGWIDALVYESIPGKNWKQVVEARFAGGGDWDVVGVVLTREELELRGKTLARDLVPGDVVIALSTKNVRARAYVNLGDQWAPARLKISRSR
jgi:hypothetical protein